MTMKLAALLLMAMLVGCAGTEPDRGFSAAEPETAASVSLPPRLEALAPNMRAWLDSVEARQLARGRGLSASQRRLARAVGVQNPGRVRLVVTRTFPMPVDSALRREAVRLGFGRSPESARAVGYAILLRPEAAGRRDILAHELVHVAQMESLGRQHFFKRYFAELANLGYDRAPLERQARAVAARYR